MNQLKLYTFKLCPFAHRVRLALAEKDLQAEHIEIDLKNKPADFKSISPYGRVPVLLHGDFKLWESAIVMEYIEEAFPQRPLMPEAAAEKAKARLWIDFANARLFAATHRLIFTADELLQSELVAEMGECVRILEHSLTASSRSGPFLLGSQFTLADIALYPWFEQAATLERFNAFKMPADCKAVAKWREAIAARPAVKACSRSDDFYAESYQRYLAA